MWRGEKLKISCTLKRKPRVIVQYNQTKRMRSRSSCQVDFLSPLSLSALFATSYALTARAHQHRHVCASGCFQARDCCSGKFSVHKFCKGVLVKLSGQEKAALRSARCRTWNVEGSGQQFNERLRIFSLEIFDLWLKSLKPTTFFSSLFFFKKKKKKK